MRNAYLRMFWLHVALLFVMLNHCGRALAEDYILERAYLEDKTAQRTLDEVITQEFTPYQGLLGRGFSNSAFWIRLKIRGAVTTGPLVLKVQPSYLDDIQIYQSVGGFFQKKVIGDNHAYADRDHPETSFGVAIVPSAGEHYIYARLKTTSTNLIHFEMTDEKSFVNAEGKRDLILGMLMGSVLLALVFSIFHFVRYTEKLFLLFSIFLASEFLFIGSVTGYLSRYILPSNPVWADSTTSFFVLSFIFSAALFHREFAVSEIRIRWLSWLFTIFCGLHSFLFFLLFFGYPKIALQLNVAIMLFFLALMLAIPVIYIFNRNRIAPGIALSYLLISFSAIFGILPLIKDMNNSTIILHSNLFNGLITSSVIFFLLKIKQIKKDKLADIVRHELVFERQRGELQSRFMAMLAHQIKTPLSVIKLACDSLANTYQWTSHMNRAVRDIELILDRCLQLDRLEKDKPELKKTLFDPLIVIRQEINKLSHPERVRLVIKNNSKLNTDKDFFSMIINNLMENASKYSTPGSKIDVIVASRQSDHRPEWVINISNEVGVFGSPEAGRVFEKYYRNPRAEKISGTGLGLFLVYTLLDMLNGGIRYSDNTKTVTFEIWLPN